MTAKEAKAAAERGLQMIREFHDKPHGDAYIVGAAWAIFARIAGDVNARAPWDEPKPQEVKS